jgi:hypothetical protein
MFTAMTRSAAEAPAGLTRGPAGAFIIPYPCEGEVFDGCLMPEDRIAELHIAAGAYQDISSTDAARLRALPRRLPAPPAFAPRSHRYAGKPTGFDHEGPRAPRRKYGAFHHGIKRD